MTTTDTEVTITQADRDALERIDDALGFLMDDEREIVLHAFARHRTLTPAQAAGPVLMEALKDTREVLALAAKPARLDPDKHFTSQVQGLGDAFGYGALMTCASALWRQGLGDLAGGEFAAGPCIVTVQKQLERIDAAITQAEGPQA